MRFYVSWYPGDPWYPRYDDDCAMLVSITSVSQIWTLDRYATKPRYLMLDSGGYRYATAPGERPNPSEAFDRQMRVLEAYDGEAVVCALDYPVLDPDAGSNERDRCIDQTVAYAYEFKSLLEESRPREDVAGMAIVQGYDVSSMVYCAHRLGEIGFPLYGVGSLAPLRHKEEILERVGAVQEVLGPELHVFGVSAVDTVAALADLGVSSVDSSRPAKAAMYNQVFYSRPFRRFSVAESQDRTGVSLPASRRLSEALPCTCPVCAGRSNPGILKLGSRRHVALRTLHNYWHLKEALV